MYKIDFNKPVSVFFLGIGGISMSGLAEILNDAGFKVSGSDWHESDITRHLVSKGINVSYGEDAAHISSDIDVCVLTSAIKDTNKEYIRIKELGIPVLSRAELLGQLMKNYRNSIAISGTHGKTTTTSMVSDIFLKANLNPTLSIGGILKSIGGNIRVGGPEFFVTEACEYTNSFLSFFPTVGIILNIEEDHLDFFKDINDIRNSFKKFANLIPEDGLLIINADIDNYEEITEGLKCKVVTFALENKADITAKDIVYNNFGCATFTAVTNDISREFSLKVPGKHNVDNALAAIALADYMNIDVNILREALFDYTGADRRFEYKGEFNGVTVIDDYAHHPTEIAATLNAAKNYPHKTLWCVFQPHTFSRTKSFMKDFAKSLSIADEVVLADIYAARETDNLGISSETLCEEIRNLGHKCSYLNSFESIENFLKANCIKGDLLITMGAGNVHEIGENLVK